MSSDYRSRGLRRVFSLLTIAWMILIFSFSAASADESSKMSLSVGKLAAERFVPEYRTWTKKEQEAFAERIDHPVRKTAHAAEYAVLGFLMLVSFAGMLFSGPKQRGRAAWICSVLYAVTDEIHQLFVPGRSCQASDVLIDGCGAAFGVLLGGMILRILRTKNKILWTRTHLDEK